MNRQEKASVSYCHPRCLLSDWEDKAANDKARPTVNHCEAIHRNWIVNCHSYIIRCWGERKEDAQAPTKATGCVAKDEWNKCWLWKLRKMERKLTYNPVTFPHISFSFRIPQFIHKSCKKVGYHEMCHHLLYFLEGDPADKDQPTEECHCNSPLIKLTVFLISKKATFLHHCAENHN